MHKNLRKKRMLRDNGLEPIPIKPAVTDTALITGETDPVGSMFESYNMETRPQRTGRGWDFANNLVSTLGNVLANRPQRGPTGMMYSAPPPPPKKNNTGLYIAGGVGVVLLAVLLMKKKK